MMHCFDAEIEKMSLMTLKGHDSQYTTGRNGVGMLFYQFDYIRPTAAAVAVQTRANSICSEMLNRAYRVMADGNCFAVTVTVSPCRTSG